MYHSKYKAKETGHVYLRFYSHDFKLFSKKEEMFSHEETFRLTGKYTKSKLGRVYDILLAKKKQFYSLLHKYMLTQYLIQIDDISKIILQLMQLDSDLLTTIYQSYGGGN